MASGISLLLLLSPTYISKYESKCFAVIFSLRVLLFFPFSFLFLRNDGPTSEVEEEGGKSIKLRYFFTLKLEMPVETFAGDLRWCWRWCLRMVKQPWRRDSSVAYSRKLHALPAPSQLIRVLLTSSWREFCRQPACVCEREGGKLIMIIEVIFFCESIN